MNKPNARAPIIVELTEIEQRGYNYAGNAEKDELAMQIELILLSEGLEGEHLQATAKAMTEASQRARDKIEEARRFEIRVVPAPDASGVAVDASAAEKRSRRKTVSSRAKKGGG